MISNGHAKRDGRWRRRLLFALAVGLTALVCWLALTDNPRVWPVRNTVQYHLVRRWDALVGARRGAPITLRGMVQTTDGAPIPQAWVLVAGQDGTPYSTETDAVGAFTIQDVPAGAYVPIAGASGYADRAFRRFGLFRFRLNGQSMLDLRLAPVRPAVPPPVPVDDFRLAEPEYLRIDAPIPSSAVRRAVHFDVAGRPNQTTLFYTPNDGGVTALPTLLVVYPGPADQWETVSFPLAAAGYAVLAVGPAYALDLEPDVADLERLLAAMHAGHLPRADPARVGVLGGSYSSLHVFRLLERDRYPIGAALFLGPPTDLFEMRRQFSAGEIAPPFGLDQALIALGFPDRKPEPYWRYSARYHARSLDVPMLLVHSKADEIVPFQQSEILSAELQRIGQPHALHILEGMGHYLLATERTPSVDALFNLTIDFFAEHLVANE